MKTDEDEAFEEIERKQNAQGWRKRQIANAVDDDIMCYRNDVLEEVARALEQFHIPFGQDTINSFATFIRDMKR
jgi:hypothetical protein